MNRRFEHFSHRRRCRCPSHQHLVCFFLGFVFFFYFLFFVQMVKRCELCALSTEHRTHIQIQHIFNNAYCSICKLFNENCLAPNDSKVDCCSYRAVVAHNFNMNFGFLQPGPSKPEQNAF